MDIYSVTGLTTLLFLFINGSCHFVAILSLMQIVQVCEIFIEGLTVKIDSIFMLHISNVREAVLIIPTIQETFVNHLYLMNRTCRLLTWDLHQSLDSIRFWTCLWNWKVIQLLNCWIPLCMLWIIYCVCVHAKTNP